MKEAQTLGLDNTQMRKKAEPAINESEANGDEDRGSKKLKSHNQNEEEKGVKLGAG
ncbi:MAG: hypothetical protein Q9208_002221 [Pyrenodesmia sp. 3 TL-2023]